MSSNKTVRLLAVGLAFLALRCADESKPPGSIHVQWRIGGLQTCDDAGLSQVAVQLYQAGSPDLIDEISRECLMGEATLSDVPSGKYDVVVEGLAAVPGTEDLRATYRGEFPGLKVASGKLASVPDTIILQGKPAELVLLWKFESGYECFFEGVEDVRVRVWGENGVAVPVARDVFPCNMGDLADEEDGAQFIGGDCGLSHLRGLLLTDVTPQALVVELQGYDAEGNATHYATAQAAPGLGEQACVSLFLKRCAPEGCP